MSPPSLASLKAQRSTACRFGQEGFTLIEMLVVMGIIAVLAGTLIIGLPAMLRAGDVSAMETWITSLAAQIEAYENRPRNGDYPPTSIDEAFAGVGPLYSKENCGIEAVVVCLNRRGEAGAYTFEDDKVVSLDNFDGDRSKDLLTNFETTELFEVIDRWETPLAYFHHRDYGAVEARNLGRITMADGSVVQVRPWKNPKTKGFYNSRTFQIISAGPDKEFNTEDDITNFSH